MSRKPTHAQPLTLHPLRIAVLTALAILPAVAPAATIPSGTALDASEIPVNSTVASDQDVPRVARDAAGDSVVVWSSFNQASGTSSWDIVAQRYNAAGQPQGGEILVNTFTTGFQNHPSVAMDAAGDFVVAWQSANQASGTSQYDIYARQFNATGQPVQAGEFLVNTVIANNQASPSVAMDAAGDFVVAWTSVGQAAAGHVDIFARTYNAAGTAQQAGEFLVNSLSILVSTHTTPSVAMDAAGDFVVAWQVLDQASGSSGYDIFAQRYNAAAQAQGGEIQVNTVIANNQLNPSVAMDAAGDFVVAWDSYDQVTGSSLEDVYARQFNANGTAVQATEFLVNTITTDRQNTPSVAMDPGGDFVVAWASYDQASGTSKHDIYARQFNAAGTAQQAGEFLVNTFTTSEQLVPAVATDAAGDFVVVWQSYDQIGASTSYDVFARRFQGPEQLDLAATLAASSSSVNGGTGFSVTLGLNNNTAVANFGNATINAALGIADGITADFTLPAGVTRGTVAGSNWSCGTPANNDMTCTYSGTVAAATAFPGLTINFTAPAGASAAVNLPFQVNVGGARQDSNNANNTAAANFSNASINSALGVADGISADFTLPAGVTLGTVAGTNWSCGKPANNAMSCTYSGSVAAATAIPGLTANFTAPAGASAAVNLPFQAHVGSTRQDSNNTNDTGSASVQVKAVGGGGGGGGSGGGGYSSSGGGAMDLLSLSSLGLPLLLTWFTGRRRQRR